MNSPTGIIALLFLLIIFSGCVSIPEDPYVLSRRAGAVPMENYSDCDRPQTMDMTLPAASPYEGIDPEGFTLLNWNMMKGGGEGWEDDFARLADGADLLTLQEAYLNDGLHRLLYLEEYQWELTAAFLMGRREAGVLTGSRTAPVFFCASRFTEPLIGIPKTALISLYPMSGTGRSLLVANVHLINFTLGTDDYRDQLRELERLLSGHQGPILLAGDFNTWSEGRMTVVEGLADSLGLRKVVFSHGDPSFVLGRPVDHIFYRGLEIVEARAERVSTSDHHPLLAKFRMAER
jgi:endonuclease/exonuclease/phosphatase (EEP) superfamily protein YafD